MQTNSDGCQVGKMMEAMVATPIAFLLAASPPFSLCRIYRCTMVWVRRCTLRIPLGTTVPQPQSLVDRPLKLFLHLIRQWWRHRPIPAPRVTGRAFARDRLGPTAPLVSA